jgi:hypothetical protein
MGIFTALLVSSDKEEDDKDQRQDDPQPQPNHNNDISMEPFYCDVTWPAKLTAMTIYYALHYYKDMNQGIFTDDIDDLILPHDIIQPFDITILLFNRNNTSTTTKSQSDDIPIDFTVIVLSKTTSAINGNHDHAVFPDQVTFNKNDSVGIYARVQSDRYLTAGTYTSKAQIIESVGTMTQ